MKKQKLIFWITTIIIVIMEGLIPAFTFQTQLAKDGVRNLGYPLYFGNALVIFKVLGSITLILPKAPARLKEWAYAGFAFDFIFAAISNCAIFGFGFAPILPLIFLGLLILSYTSYHNMYTDRSIVSGVYN